MSYKYAPDLLGQAINFREIYDQPIGTYNKGVIDLQLDLIAEEFYETVEACEEFMLKPKEVELQTHALKELADLVYVCFQLAAAVGWELDEAVERVHESNLSKLVDGRPLKNDSGKVMKGPNYEPPYLEDLI